MQSLTRQQFVRRAALLLTLVAVPLSLWSLTFTETYRDWRWARATLPDLQRSLARYPGDPVLLYQIGLRLSAQERFAEALPFLERATGLDPDKPAYRDAWAKALLATGQISQAFTILSQFSRTHPDSAEGHLYLARFYIAQNATARATEELEATLRLKPTLAEAWWLEALALQQQNQAPALGKARKAVELEPNNTAFRVLLGELLITSGDPKAALAEFDAALQRDPKLIPANVYRARILLDQADPAGALAASERALAEAPENAEALLLRGRALSALHQTDKAIPVLEQAVALAPDDPAPVQELCRALNQQNRTADAARWQQELQRRTASRAQLLALEDAHRRQPGDPETARNLARFWASRGNVTLTVRYYAKALRQAQDAPPVLVAAANDLTAAGYAEHAVELIKRVQAQTQLNPASFEAMGNALLALGRAHEAAIQYETAARWWPEKREVYRKKLDAFFAQQAAHPTDAMRLYGQAVTLEHSQVGPLLPEVLELLHKAVALEPKNVVIRRELVRVLFERQERERSDAIREARALLALSPDDTVGHALLAVLLVNSDTDANLDEVQYHLNQAKSDPTMASVVYYGAGRLALRRNQPDAALVALRTARRLAPDSDPICYALAQAEHLYGSKEIADRLFKEYAQRRAKKSEEVELLRNIGQNPDQPALYRKAITFYQQNGQVAQAAAIQREFQRRFKAIP